MSQVKFERIEEGAYFLVDVTGFQTTVAFYDPIMANQTILSCWDASRTPQHQPPESEERVVVEEPEKT